MRKSIDFEKVNTGTKIERELYIVRETRDPTAEDFLPSYNYTYEGIEKEKEAEDMARTLRTFIKSNEEIVLAPYQSRDIESVQEGFARGIAICELFFRSIYLDLEGGGGVDEEG